MDRLQLGGQNRGRVFNCKRSFMYPVQWKGSNRKQRARWQHVSRLKVMHSVFGKINCGGLKHNSLSLGLVLPSGG